MKTKRNAQLSLQKLDIQTDSVCYVRMNVLYVVYTDRHTRIYSACNRYRRGLPKTKNTEANLAEPEDIRRGASRIFLCVCCCCCCFFLWSYCFILLPTLFLLKIRFFLFCFLLLFWFRFSFCILSTQKQKQKLVVSYFSLLVFVFSFMFCYFCCLN